jgi:hypothetical protein
MANDRFRLNGAKQFGVNLNNKSSVVTFVEDRWENRSRNRGQLEEQWYVNVAQYMGLQNHYYDRGSGMLKIPDAPDYRVRLVINRLLPFVRRSLSRVVSQRPRWICQPASGDVEDLMTSLVSNKSLKYYWRWLNMALRLVEARLWMVTTGNAFIGPVTWDPDKGPELRIEGDDLERVPPELRELAQEGLHLGDVDVPISSPFEVDPDPNAKCMDDCTHVIHTVTHDIQELVDRYGNKAKKIGVDSADHHSITSFYQRKIESLGGVTAGGGDYYQKEEDDTQVVTHTLWVRPSKQFPGGRRIVVAGGQVLQSGDLPNPFKQIPFVHLRELQVPGRFWGTCALEHGIPIQADLNRGTSQMVENRNLMSRPKWLVPFGARLQQSALTSQPGEIVEFYPPFKPEAWTPPALPNYVRYTLEAAERYLNHVLADNDVSNARVPPSVRSGTGIATLQEQDAQAQGYANQELEVGFGRVGIWVLQLLAKNVTEERLIAITGPDHEVDALTFLGKDLVGRNVSRPGVNYFDVSCDLGTSLPESRDGRMNYTLQLVEQGILHPVNDRAKILYMLNLGTDEPVLNDASMDRQNARVENARLAEGEQLPLWTSDDDLIHIEEHLRHEKSPQYRRSATPESQQAFVAHLSEHVTRLTQGQAQAQQLQDQPPQPEEIAPPAEQQLLEQGAF